MTIRNLITAMAVSVWSFAAATTSSAPPEHTNANLETKRFLTLGAPDASTGKIAVLTQDGKFACVRFSGLTCDGKPVDSIDLRWGRVLIAHGHWSSICGTEFVAESAQLGMQLSRDSFEDTLAAACKQFLPQPPTTGKTVAVSATNTKIPPPSTKGIDRKAAMLPKSGS